MNESGTIINNFLEIFSLKDKVAIITVGIGILGSATGKRLGKVGAKIAICDLVNTRKIVEKFSKEDIKTKGYYIDVMNKDKIKE